VVNSLSWWWKTCESGPVLEAFWQRIGKLLNHEFSVSREQPQEPMADAQTHMLVLRNEPTQKVLLACQLNWPNLYMLCSLNISHIGARNIYRHCDPFYFRYFHMYVFLSITVFCSQSQITSLFPITYLSHPRWSDVTVLSKEEVKEHMHGQYHPPVCCYRVLQPPPSFSKLLCTHLPQVLGWSLQAMLQLDLCSATAKCIIS
jgi:hypothetical protein